MNCTDIEKLKDAIESADHIVVGAGAGLSSAAGMLYTGNRFNRYFSDFAARYGFRDMYSGGFYPYKTLEAHWAYWSRYIWINRYAPIPGTVYKDLLALVADKDYFVLTTNVDHCFQRSGFDKERLFYTQGDYGLFQCSKPCCAQTHDNKDFVRKMLLAQGFSLSAEDELLLPGEDEAPASLAAVSSGHASFDCVSSGQPLAPAKQDSSTRAPATREFSLRAPSSQAPLMAVPSELVPYCPRCGSPLSMNLRADDTFVEDEGWHEARARYESFLRACDASGGHVLLLELGVGFNTPIIVKYPFWRMAAQNENVTYACINQGEAYVPDEIAARGIGINGDIAAVLGEL